MSSTFSIMFNYRAPHKSSKSLYYSRLAHFVTHAVREGRISHVKRDRSWTATASPAENVKNNKKNQTT